jgi:hypothetical protein
MQTTHPPGLWRVVGGTEVRGADGTIICNTADYRVPKPDMVAFAQPDAALIAARTAGRASGHRSRGGPSHGPGHRPRHDQHHQPLGPRSHRPRYRHLTLPPSPNPSPPRAGFFMPDLPDVEPGQDTRTGRTYLGVCPCPSGSDVSTGHSVRAMSGLLSGFMSRSHSNTQPFY